MKRFELRDKHGNTNAEFETEEELNYLIENMEEINIKKLEILNKINDLTTKLSQGGKDFYDRYKDDLTDYFIEDLILEYLDNAKDFYDYDLRTWTINYWLLEKISKLKEKLGYLEDEILYLAFDL